MIGYGLAAADVVLLAASTSALSLALVALARRLGISVGGAPRPRWRAWTVAILVWAFLIGGWLAHRAHEAHRALTAAEVALRGMNASANPGAIETSVRSAQRQVDLAHEGVRDPVWRLAAATPVLGSSFDFAAESIAIVDRLTDRALPPLVTVLHSATTHPVVHAGRVDLNELGVLRPLVQIARDDARKGLRAAGRLPKRGVAPALAARREELISRLDSLTRALDDAHVALGLAPAMLGADTPRRYFVAVQNNAESRATGGLIGAYAVLRAEMGKLVWERSGTDTELTAADSPVVDLGAEFAAHYDPESARTEWTSAGLTPHWPSAARIIVGLWRAQGGASLDGVIGIDPISMRDLLRVTGPVTTDGRRIDADNIVPFVMRDEYVEFANDDYRRKDALRQIAAALLTAVVSRTTGTTGLNGLIRSGSSGHVQIYSTHATEQSALANHALGGALGTTTGAFLEVVTQNAAGNKLDYYIRRAVTYQRLGGGRAQIQLVITNTVQPEGLPVPVRQRLDRPSAPLGQTKLLLSFYVSVGCEVGEVRVNGRPVPVSRGREQGHGYASLEVEVAPGQPLAIAADVTDPGGPLTYRQQPLVVDDDISARDLP